MKNAPTFYILFYSICIIYACTPSENPTPTQESPELPHLPSKAYSLREFEGIWSGEGKEKTTSQFIMELSQSQDTISGTLQYETWNESGQSLYYSGIWKGEGKVTNDSATLSLQNPNGNTGPLAKLYLRNSTELTIEMPPSFKHFPQKTKLIKQ